jgi:hypothetical protein
MLRCVVMFLILSFRVKSLLVLCCDVSFVVLCCAELSRCVVLGCVVLGCVVLACFGVFYCVVILCCAVRFNAVGIERERYLEKP